MFVQVDQLLNDVRRNDRFAAAHVAEDDQLLRSRGIVPVEELRIRDYPLASTAGSKSTNLTMEFAPLPVFIDTE